MAYTWAVEGEAYRYLVSLPKRRRKNLERALDALAASPFEPSLHSEKDEAGSTLDIIEAENHLVTYHAEHAVRRIRVIAFRPLP